MSAYRNWTIFKDNLGSQNPIIIQVLGICSTLAVTNVVKNTLVMCLGLIFTTAFSNLTISLLRNIIPARVRMMAEVLIIACMVIIVDIYLKAYFPLISRQLGPYVGLIITNCIVMGHAEAVALTEPPVTSFIDGLSAGIGYSYVLMIIAVIRELLGTGCVWGINLLGPWWENWGIMVMAPGGFFVLALFVWVVRGRMAAKQEATAKGA
jgi:Na+-transporting NADH:ubiquinone oxidoreductase subunit D